MDGLKWLGCAQVESTRREHRCSSSVRLQTRQLSNTSTNSQGPGKGFSTARSLRLQPRTARNRQASIDAPGTDGNRSGRSLVRIGNTELAPESTHQFSPTENTMLEKPHAPINREPSSHSYLKSRPTACPKQTYSLLPTREFQALTLSRTIRLTCKGFLVGWSSVLSNEGDGSRGFVVSEVLTWRKEGAPWSQCRLLLYLPTKNGTGDGDQSPRGADS